MSLVTVNLIMLVIFLRLFSFFLNYRTSLTLKKLKKEGKKPNKKLTLFNKLIICWIIFLCALILWSIGSLLTDGIAKHYYGLQFPDASIHVYYLSPAYKIAFPIKDLFLALSFSYLYYHQGLKQAGKKLNQQK